MVPENRAARQTWVADAALDEGRRGADTCSMQVSGRDRRADLDADAERLHRLMTELVKRYQFRDRNRICCFGVSVSGCYVLDELAEHGDQTMQALAGGLFLSVSTMTRVVGQLVRRGLVRRQRDPGDGRVVWVSLTREGKDVLARIHKGLIDSQREILRPLSPRERAAALRVLARLGESAGEWQERCAGPGAGRGRDGR